MPCEGGDCGCESAVEMARLLRSVADDELTLEWRTPELLQWQVVINVVASVEAAESFHSALVGSGGPGIVIEEVVMVERA